MHHGIGVLALVAAIAFAFGEHAARAVVGTVLAAGALFIAYVLVRVVTGTI